MMNYVIGPVGPKFSPVVSKELKEHADIFNDTLIGCFVYFQNVIR